MSGSGKTKLEQYQLEPSETSSMTEGEIKGVLEKAGLLQEEKKNSKGTDQNILQRILARGMPSLPPKEDMEKARRTTDYADLQRKFDDTYGSRPKPRDIEDAKRKMDNKYNLMNEHANEISKGGCDIQLYKNKLLKDLGDVSNDLKEAHNIVNILTNDRNMMKDLFGIYGVELKGLRALKKNLENELQDRDKEIEKLRLANQGLNNKIDSNKSTVEGAKKDKADAKKEVDALQRQANEAKADTARMKRMVDPMKDEIGKLKKENEKLRNGLKNKNEELETLKPEVAIAREDKKNLTMQVAPLKEENERLKKDNEKLINEKQELTNRDKDLIAENTDLQAKVQKLSDDLKTAEELLESINAESRDLKPDNDMLTKKNEELMQELHDLLDENAKLKKQAGNEPKDLALIPELQERNKGLNDDLENLRVENERLKKELEDILEEKRRKNADRRQRKEEHLKKILDEATKKFDENKKKQDEKTNIAEASVICNNVMTTQDDLSKYSNLEGKTPDPANAFLEEDIPEVEVPEMPQIDQKLLDEQANTYGKGQSAVVKSYFEPKDYSKADKAPYKSIAGIFTAAITRQNPTPQDDIESDPLYEVSNQGYIGEGPSGGISAVPATSNYVKQQANASKRKA